MKDNIARKIHSTQRGNIINIIFHCWLFLEWFAQKWAHHIDLAIIFYLRPTLGVSVTLFPRSEATLAPSVRVHPKGENEAFLANLAIPCPNGNVYHRKWFLKYQNIQLGIYKMIRIFAADLPRPLGQIGLKGQYALLRQEPIYMLQTSNMVPVKSYSPDFVLWGSQNRLGLCWQLWWNSLAG